MNVGDRVISINGAVMKGKTHNDVTVAVVASPPQIIFVVDADVTPLDAGSP